VKIEVVNIEVELVKLILGNEKLGLVLLEQNIFEDELNN